VSDHPSALTVTTADLSKSRPPRWAWQGWLPIGSLSLIVGCEGVGKGTLAAWLIARMTKGDLPGHMRHRPVNAAIIGDEDGFNSVWVPRLHAAGCDLKRVKQLESESGLIDLQEDEERLRLAVDLENVEILFLTP
jgi:hypothetical protein